MQAAGGAALRRALPGQIGALEIACPVDTGGRSFARSMPPSPLGRRLVHVARRLTGRSDPLLLRLNAVERRLADLEEWTRSGAARPYYYLGGNRALTRLSNGLPFFVNTNDKGVGAWIVMVGGWENFVDEVLTRLCRPGMRVLDLGANVGYYTIKLAALVGADGHVLCLEPNPELFTFIRDNIAINGFESRIRAEQMAAAGQRGEAEFQFDIHHAGGGTLLQLPPEYEAQHAMVQTTPVDDLIEGQAGFDLIKVDVEGWEPEAFKGMQATLARSGHASIVTEVSWGHWARFGDPAEILLDVLGSRDGLFVIHHDGTLERVDRSDVSPFRNQMRYALLTHWSGAAEQELGSLLRR